MSVKALELLEAATEDLADDSVHGRALGAEILELDRLKNKLEAQIARRLAAFSYAGEQVLYGHKSTAAWLIAAERMARTDAYRRVHVARDVEQLPGVAALWREGAISTRHVEVITRIRHAAKADAEFAEFEPALAEVAAAGTPDDIALVGQQWRHALDDAKQKPDDKLANEQWEQRGLRLSDLDGLGFIDGTFDAGDMASIRTALTKECERLRVAGDERSYSQQLADAFASICCQYLGGLPTGNNHPHFIVATDLETMLGRSVGLCETDHGTRISPDTARRIACDAEISRILVNGDSVPLELGRSFRFFNLDQRKAMIIRDGACRFPGCRRPPDQCQTHHTNPWECGGNTDIDDGGLLCWEHHRLCHEGMWTITVLADLSWEWRRPDDTLHGTSHPRALPRKIPIRRAA